MYHKIIKQTKSLEIEILNFVPFDVSVELMRIKVKNRSGKDIKIVPTSFIPLYGRSEKCLRDHRHVTSLLNRVYLGKQGIYLKPTMVFDENGHKANETTYFVLGFENEGLAPIGQFPSLDYFYGQGDILHPDAIEKAVQPAIRESPEFDGKEACAAFRFRERILKKDQEADYFLIMGIEDNSKNIKDVFKRFNSREKLKTALRQPGNTGRDIFRGWILILGIRSLIIGWSG